MKTIAIACDHGGYQLKLAVMRYLEKEGYAYKDFGCNSEDAVDYPDYGVPACEAVVSGECERAILICGTGIGMSMCANKVRGIRAACCSDTFSARMTRLHNDANALCIGGRVVGEGLALDLVDLFLKTEFMGSHHSGRIAKVMQIENK